MGRIGRAVADRARSFGMKIHYYNRSRLENNLEKDDKDPYDLTGFYNSNKYTMEELRPLLKQLLMVMYMSANLGIKQK